MTGIDSRSTSPSGPPVQWGSSCSSKAPKSSEGTDSYETPGSKMQRWQERKQARRQKRSNGSQQYGDLARAVLLSNNGDPDIGNMLRQKNLDITCSELLGMGSFARVYKGVWTRRTQEDGSCQSSSSNVAVKVIRRRRSSPYMSQGGSIHPPAWLQREARSAQLCHANIVRVYETWITSPPYLFVMEFCAGGSLHDLLCGVRTLGTGEAPRQVRLSWQQRLKAALDVAAGMEYLHSAGIMHRDLKTQNVLLAEQVKTQEDELNAKVCDFGLARCLEDTSELSRQVGSWHYMAPEVFSGDIPDYDEKVDVYSYAMLLYELIAECVPFTDVRMDNAKLGLFVLSGKRPEAKLIPSDVPEVLRQLMQQAWSGEPLERPDFRHARELLQEACYPTSPQSSAHTACSLPCERAASGALSCLAFLKPACMRS